MAAVTATAQRLERQISWFEVFGRLEQVDNVGTNVYGVPRGGMICAGFMSKAVNVIDPADADVIIDDVVDSGRTRDEYKARYPGTPFVGLWDKTKDDRREWLIFPWEQNGHERGPTDAVVRILEFIGEDPTREGLVDTPDRVLRALREMTSGKTVNPEKLLEARFTVDHDEMVLLRGVRFTSLCEHHILPFIGSATVGYIPNGKVIGLSKLARVVDCFARRLQLQERMTEQIAQTIQKHVAPLGVGVIIKASHSCLGCRGAKQPDTDMVTSCLLGYLRERPETRAEFMRLGLGIA